MTYEDWAFDLFPAWLRGPWAKKWANAFGLLADTIKDAAKDAVKARFVLGCPDDAVPYIASDREVDRGKDETLASWRLRTANMWETAQTYGTKAGIEEHIRVGLALTAVSLFSWVEGWSDANATNNARFWIAIDQPNPWGALLCGDDTICSDETLNGSTMTLTELRELRRIVRKWRADHELAMAFVVSFGPALTSASYAPGTTAIAGQTTLPVGRFVNYSGAQLCGDATVCGYYFE